jgi:hypothetical protein
MQRRFIIRRAGVRGKPDVIVANKRGVFTFTQQ